MKNQLSTILLVLILIIGLSLLLYPSFSNYWNSSRQTQMITHYVEAVAEMGSEEFETIRSSAQDYNASLVGRRNSFQLSEEQEERYNKELNLGGDGVMGYVEVPASGIMLPIYHGVSEEVLQVAIGHLDWSSLPTGGESTHCVVSGHRGLPSARLFTDLDILRVGDIFMIHVLDEILTYEVDQIKIVLPYETDDLMIVEGEDLCTLVTCTPYGVNSHRMLVRGHRIENIENQSTVRVTADAIQIEPLIVAPVLAAPMLLIFFLSVMLPKTRKKNDEELFPVDP